MTKQRPTEVYMESNPNPNSMKFVINYNLVPEGVALDYPNKEEAKDSPLALELFAKEKINRVFIAANFITLNKEEGAEWDELANELRPFIKNYLQEGKQVLSRVPKEFLAKEVVEDQVEAKIISVLEEYIKPAVEMDGGAIIFKSFDEGKLTVTLQGSCSGCPSSTLTLKSGIENLMKRMVPEVGEVVAEEG